MAIALIACNGGDPATTAPSETVSTQPTVDPETESPDDDSDLRPAAEVEAENISAGTVKASIGGPAIEYVDGVTVEIRSVTVGGDAGGPWLEVDVRTENRGDDTNNPNVRIVCGGNPEEGGWQASSTFDLFAALPQSTFNDGTVHLLLPGDGRFGEPIAGCAEPAVIRVSPTVTFGGQGIVDFAIPAQTVIELNAAAGTSDPDPVVTAPPEPDPTNTASEGTVPDDVRDGVAAGLNNYFDAWSAGDFEEAFQWFSQDCPNPMSFTEFATSSAEARIFLQSLLGIDAAEMSLQNIEVLSWDGNQAIVDSEFLTPDGLPFGDDDTGVSVFEDGRWKTQDCEFGRQ